MSEMVILHQVPSVQTCFDKENFIAALSSRGMLTDGSYTLSHTAMTTVMYYRNPPEKPTATYHIYMHYTG